MNDQAKPDSRCWRRFLRFSVRGLMVLLLVVGGWLGWIVRSARIQREAVAAIRKSGGFVEYQWYWKDRLGAHGGRPDAPEWLVSTLGDDYFGSVVSVFYYKNNASDAVIDHIVRLPNLIHVELMGSEVTDAGVSRLSTFTRLTELGLHNARLSDSGLAHLAGLTALEMLTLDCTHISDAGLISLDAMKRLKHLSLRKTEVSDEGLLRLRGLANLEFLDLEGTRVTEAGMANLGRVMPEPEINY